MEKKKRKMNEAEEIEKRSPAGDNKNGEDTANEGSMGGPVCRQERATGIQREPVGHEDLNYQFGWSRYIMKYVGIWPEERKWNRLSNYIVLGPVLTMLCFGCGPQTIDLPFIAHDLDLLVENLSMANMTVTISLVKTITFWIHGKPLKSLLRCIAKDWATVKTKTERERMMNIARISRKTMVACTIMCEFAAIFFVCLRLFLMKRNDSKSLILQGYFPYNTTISPNFELILIAQTIAIIYTAASYSAVDTFVAMLVLHACGQLSNIKHDLMDVHSCGNSNDLQMKLKKIAQKHDYVNRFAETVENCFNVMLLIQMLSCIVQLCFQSFQAIMSFGEEAKRYMIFQIAFLCFYVVCVMMQLYIYCYVGEKLTFESTDIANAVYHCEWYNLRPKDARLLVIIMCRARASPLKLTAGKFCWFTVSLYTHVLKTSISCISVLYAIL